MGAAATAEPGTVALEPGIDEFPAADDDAVGEVLDALQKEFALDGETGFFYAGFLRSFAYAATNDFSIFPDTGATRDAEHLRVVDEGTTVTFLPLGCRFL